MNTSTKLWAVVPAAGIGSRMEAALPKQYLTLNGLSVLQITLNKLLAIKELEGIVVAVAPNDVWFKTHVAAHPKVHTVEGGTSRALSVLNAVAHINALSDHAWVLVHDAARPCVELSRMQNLISTVRDANYGGILAVPAADTLKKVDGNAIQKTLDRSVVWQAHTPQMFKGRELHAAITAGLKTNSVITDESSAMEAAGQHPLIVQDSKNNIKITQPEDLSLAEFILSQQLEMS